MTRLPRTARRSLARAIFLPFGIPLAIVLFAVEQLQSVEWVLESSRVDQQHLLPQLGSMQTIREATSKMESPGGRPLGSVAHATDESTNEIINSTSAESSRSWKLDPETRPIWKILRNAGYDFNDPVLFSETTIASLPRWSTILELYYSSHNSQEINNTSSKTEPEESKIELEDSPHSDKPGGPRIFGLETCHTYRQSVAPSARSLAVAGTFNSGTNILSELLYLNCYNKDRQNGNGVEWQVPWGKHMPASQRSQHTAKREIGKENLTNVLPVIAIRDPMTWMQSMCRQSYAVQFDHSKDPEKNLCPNIVPYEEDIKAHPRYRKKKYMPAHAKYTKELTIHYTSIAHMWNEWYSEYLNATFPRIIVRLEDLVFRAEEVIPKICDCIGGVMVDETTHLHARVSNRNKGIDKRAGTGLLGTIMKLGNRTIRRKGYQKIQLEAAHTVLDPLLMEKFGYNFEDP